MESCTVLAKQVEMYNTLCDNLGCTNHLQVQDVVTIN